MTASFKFFAVAVPIVGGGIGAPVYFLTANKNTVANTPRLQGDLSETAGVTSQKTADLKKISCSFSDVTSGSASALFLKDQSKDDKLYSYVSCYELGEQREDTSPLGANWTALFPKDVLSKTFSTEIERSFEMSVQTIKGQENLINSVTTFTDLKKQSSIRVRWSNLLDTSHFSHKQTFSASIEGVEYTLKDVYLTIDSPTSSTGE